MPPPVSTTAANLWLSLKFGIRFISERELPCGNIGMAFSHPNGPVANKTIYCINIWWLTMLWCPLTYSGDRNTSLLVKIDTEWFFKKGFLGNQYHGFLQMSLLCQSGFGSLFHHDWIALSFRTCTISDVLVKRVCEIWGLSTVSWNCLRLEKRNQNRNGSRIEIKYVKIWEQLFLKYLSKYIE